MEKDCPKDCHKKAPFIFRKVVIPASIDDDSKNPPKNGAYHNVIVVYEATGNAYIYSSDGIPTRVSADIGDIDAKIAKAVGDEAELRETADQEIWTEIETIEASSDVVDVVGTYAELQQYDTSKLKDNDIIKVLADETRDDAITYYRWSTTTETFTYVGAEGPYYTASETDTLLSGKQDKLIAGTNITIAADGKTISATDTTYNVFSVGNNGLVPAPTAGDANKALKGNGTWGEVASGTIFYMNASESGATRHLYKSSDMTGLATMQDIIDANEEGQVIVRISTAVDPASYSDMYLQNAYVATGDYQMIFLDNRFYYGFDTTLTSDSTFSFSKRELQDKLTAGTNVQINGNTISATDTTYTHFTGATALADGTQGLVPGPLAGDQDKFLKADGTWATVQGGGSDTVVYTLTTTNTGTYANGVLRNSNNERVFGIEVYNNYYNGKNIILKNGANIYSVIWAGDEDEGEKYFDIARATWPGGAIYHLTITDSNSANSDEIEDRSFQETLTAGTNISIGTVSGVPNTISVSKVIPTLYGSQGQNTDGAVTQKVFTDTVGDVESILQILNSGSGV